MVTHDESSQKLSLNDSSVAGQVGGIASGNINQAQGEGAIVLSGDGHQATVDQSRHHTIINYYYREEVKELTAKSDTAVDDLPCPYRGLFHFGPSDAEFFFGREVFVKELLVAVEQRAFVPVLGASGSGKSSVVLAGLVPKLQEAGHWRFTHFRPGKDPFYSLALALVPLLIPKLNEIEQIGESRKLANDLQTGKVQLTDIVSAIQRCYPGDRILLIADQFEEIYTLGTEDATRRQFLDCLLTSLSAKPTHGSSPLVLVATMRADFLGNALSHRPFADALQRGDIKLGAMNSDELTQVIEEPAQKLGVEFEGGLVHRILEDVKSEPGNLPLLEFALTELWKRLSGKHLTHQAYEDSGKVEGALARHADEEFKILSAQDQQHVRRIFVQLVRPGQGTEDTRRLATKAELRKADWSLVQHLADARLVVTSLDPTQQQETVEVVHEALIRHWGQLRQWMETDREFRIWQDRLRGSLQQWESSQQDEGALLRGAPLAEAQEILQSRRQDLSLAEQEFIEASIESQEYEAKAKEEQHQRELAQAKKARKTAQRVTIGVSIGGVLMAGLALFSGFKTRETEIQQIKTSVALSEANLAINQHLEADIESIRAAKTLTRSLWQAIMPNSRLRTDVLKRLQHASLIGHEQHRLKVHNEPITSLAFSPDGQRLATSGEDGTARIWDFSRRRSVELKGHEKSVREVVFSSNGERLATAGRDGTVLMWDTNGKQVATLTSDGGTVWELALSPDGQYLVTRVEDGTARVWDTRKQQQTVLINHVGTIWEVAFNFDGQYLATAGEDGTARLWNLEGEQMAVLEGHDGTVWDVMFSPDGKHLATAGEDGTARLWNLEGEQLALLEGHDGPVRDVAFNPVKGKEELATSGEDGTARRWNFKGQQLAALNVHDGHARGILFSSDGKQIATYGVSDGTAHVWSIEGNKQRRFEGHDGYVSDIGFSPDGQRLATSGQDGTVRLWDIEGQQSPVFEGHESRVWKVVFSPDGQQLATSGEDGTARVWNLEGEQLAELGGHEGVYWSTEFSPDGQRLATGGAVGSIRVWLWESDEEKFVEIKGHDEYVNDVVFSPDGKLLVTGGNDRTARLWNLEGEQLAILEGHDGYVNHVVFSPDGQQLATAGDDGTARLWDLNGNQLAVLKGHHKPIQWVEFSPDQQKLITCGDDGTARLWDLNGNLLAVLRGHDTTVWEAVFSPNGEQIATRGDDGTARVWNLNGNRLAILKGHDGPVREAVFSPDGEQIATRGEDGTARVWNLNGNPLAVFQSHDGYVSDVKFSPDGQWLATSGDDGTVRLWPIEEFDELLARQCTWVRDYLENSNEVAEGDRHLCKGVAPALKSLSSFAPSLETFLEAAPLPASAESAFSDAVKKAMAAAQLAQTATSPDEWNTVASHWQQAADLMSAVPNTDANYTVAQQKVEEYQQNSQIAQQQANASSATP